MKSWYYIGLNPTSCTFAQVNFMGDKEAEKCKKIDDDEVVAYKKALTDLVKAVSIADFLGKTLGDFNHWIGFNMKGWKI